MITLELFVWLYVHTVFGNYVKNLVHKNIFFLLKILSIVIRIGDPLQLGLTVCHYVYLHVSKSEYLFSL